MAAKESGGGASDAAGAPAKDSADMVLPGFPDADSFVKHALGTVVSATKASSGLPQPGDEFDFYRSFPGFQTFCETQGDRLLHCMSKIMHYHGCRSYIKDRGKVTELEDKYDLLVDANDAILERVGILLDEAAGVNKNQQPILPSGLQPPKTIISSWNRKSGETSKRTKSETFHLLHAKNIARPQLSFREKVDNSNTPFVPKLFVKPNALKPLPEALSKSRRARKERPEDLDVPAALADFLHQQRTQQIEQDMFAHPYQYELEHFSPLAELLEKPQVQMYRPLAETPCHFVSTLDELVELNEKLVACKEFALDLEHHSYRSFLGLTCLVQISTRTEDFIVDALELRDHLYILNEAFTDPAIVKVLHGADSDVEWLQRDFGLYLVNMFDTHQAARQLNLGRHSLDHLLKLYCSVDANKQYQLADWRIRPLPEEMVQYARDDTHYLLYIYDRVREELWARSNEQPAQIQQVWHRSTAICLKKYTKPIFTEDSYLELYRKQKKHLNSQQLTAFRLLFAWRDKMARQEDESTGYVLPNHMLMKMAEQLPKEPQGIIACCNPIPPLVRQQINELHLLVQQAREMPLLKSEMAVAVKKRGPLPNTEKPENHLFGPHDRSHIPPDEKANLSDLAPGRALEHASLFSETDREEEPSSPPCLWLRASISIFNEPDVDEEKDENLTIAQRKALRIMESFENPFRMYLPAEQNPAHISQSAKFDPSSKIYEISNRWKLLSQAQLQAAAKKEVAKKVLQQKAAREVAEKACKEKAKTAVSVRQLVAKEQASKKRERAESEAGTETPKQEKKKKVKPPPPPEAEQETPKPFTPFDYSKSDLRVFAGSSKPKASAQFDPAKQAHAGKKKFSGASKVQQPAGTKSMSYMAGKSNRGFRHNWPKR
ncbi:exosome component 10 isoform X2 [Hemicordylus capensis]|uniref:exosome component 10 isoform X2 n=1 Tax=Hemicordylus capensis TaxID=884348 RepID=UPI002303394B|nr:exosome component 10 isoform X2 [Hemicordylus capensis]